MKKLILGFTSVIIIICLAFIIFQFARGDIDTNSHLHFDVLVASASNTFDEVMHADETATSLTSCQNPWDFIWYSAKSILAIFRVIYVLFQTPIIY